MLTRRNGIYYYRKAIPQRLRSRAGKREFIVSLRTRDITEALLKAHHAAKQCQQLIDDIESIGRSSVADFKVFRRSKLITETKPDGSVVTTSEKIIDPETIMALTNAGVSADQITLLIQAFLEEKGQLPASTNNDVIKEMRSSITVSDYVNRFITETELKQNKELNLHRKIHLRRLTEILPENIKIIEVSVLDAAQIRDTIKELPKYPRSFNGLSVPALIQEAKDKDPDYKKVTITTVERHFETYIQLFDKAIKDKLFVDDNPFKDIEIVQGGEKGKRQERSRKKDAKKPPFTSNELTKIFSSDLYLRYSNYPLKEGIKFWMPLLGLFTGSRMSQITSLYCDDITIDKESGIPVIDFNESADDKVVKNQAAIRRVPIHPLLIKLGLMEYADKVRSYKIPNIYGNGIRLFPELKSFHRDSYSKRVEDWFNRDFLLSLGIREVGDNKSFHAFRSTLLLLLKEAGADEFKRNCIIGWSANDDKANVVVRDHYENESLQNMYNTISAIVLPEIVYQIPPFPVEREMNFKRTYHNQWKKGP